MNKSTSTTHSRQVKSNPKECAIYDVDSSDSSDYEITDETGTRQKRVLQSIEIQISNTDTPKQIEAKIQAKINEHFDLKEAPLRGRSPERKLEEFYNHFIEEPPKDIDMIITNEDNQILEKQAYHFDPIDYNNRK